MGFYLDFFFKKLVIKNNAKTSHSMVKGKKPYSFVMPLKQKDILENPADVRN